MDFIIIITIISVTNVNKVSIFDFYIPILTGRYAIFVSVCIQSFNFTQTM